MTVHEVITKYPFVKEIFIKHGFEGITNPIQFNTVARKITVEKACKMKDVDIDVFLGDLNSAVSDNSDR